MEGAIFTPKRGYELRYIEVGRTQTGKTERAELAHFLIDSLLQSDEDFPLEKEEDIRQMLDERLAAFKQGKMELIDSEAFEAELRTRYAL